MDKHRLAAVLAAAVIWPVLIPGAHAAPQAAKNKEGNRLFEQGQYQDAEKAYLEAQAEKPGLPELFYNLGNTWIKEKKYDQALQALRRAVSEGNKGLQANGWYNAGNALFDMGNYRDSVQAYIQALRLNPADRDAKHNLELSLKKIQEQQQQPPGQGQQDQSTEGKSGGEQNQPARGNESRPQDNPEQPQSQTSAGQQPADPQSGQAERPAGTFSRERALQILDALQNQEIAEQRRLLEGVIRRKTSGRDW